MPVPKHPTDSTALTVDSDALPSAWRPVWAIVLASVVGLVAVGAMAVTVYVVVSAAISLAAAGQGPYALLYVMFALPVFVAGVPIAVSAALFLRQGGRATFFLSVGLLVASASAAVSAVVSFEHGSG